MSDDRKTILVIEDEEVLRESMADYLEDRDFEVLLAENGRIGMEKFEREKPDLVLTDLRMPEVDGLDVLRHGTERFPETPLIVVSGTGNIGDTVDALRLGAWNYILKPIEDMSVISHAVESALERAALLAKNREYQENLEMLVKERTAEIEATNQQLKITNERLKKIVETTKKITAFSEVGNFGKTLLIELADNMGATGGSLFLVEDNGMRLVHTLESRDVPEFIPFPLPEQSVLRRAMETGWPILITDIGNDGSVKPSGWDGYSDGSLLTFPLVGDNDEPIGVLTLHNKQNPPFVEQDKEIGSILASFSCESLRAARATETLKKSEANYRLLADNIADVIWTLGMDMNFKYISPSIFDLRGFTVDEAVSQQLHEMMTPESFASSMDKLNTTLQKIGSGDPEGWNPVTFEVEQYCKDGSLITTQNTAKPIKGPDGNLQSIIGITRDITARKQAEKEQKRLISIVENSNEFIGLATISADVIYVNRPGLKMVGLNRLEEAQKKTIFDFVSDEQKIELVEQILPQVIAKGWGFGEGTMRNFETGEDFNMDYRVFVIKSETTGEPEFIALVARDITEQLQAKEEKMQLEAQLQQAQKMEAVGRLAGGVAHDFNNLLTGITGNISLAQLELSPDDPLYENLEEINSAAFRAADLTRQLLAFSRKQIIKPKVIDLNELIANMLKMLGRIIGEHIELETIPAKSIGSVCVDPGHVEQIIVNLAVNARDAMPEGGRLIIETLNKTLDKAYCKEHPHVNPGEYVMMAVSDNGQGIHKETQKYIFDPFFTTKKAGEGTGLGLATVYGIVKQHGGHIEIYSEVGIGTTFKVYFPLVDDTAESIDRAANNSDLPGGTETILVVEDESMVRNIAIKILKRVGYNVLSASNGSTALQLAKKREIPIDLLLTDIVMPNMNGRELAEEITKEFPEIKILYTSGYSDDIIADQGVLEEGLEFLSKPYSPHALAQKVHSILAGSRKK